jgi:hypothetical protein
VSDEGVGMGVGSQCGDGHEGTAVSGGCGRDGRA